MAKILTVNDIHASDRPPSSCTDSYMDDILDLLGQTVGEAYRHNVSAVVWSGDVFHSKAPTRNSHRLVQKIIRLGQSYGRPWYIVPGNHDMQMDRFQSIHDTQPLGVLYAAGARALIGRCKEFPFLYGVPWQQEWSDEVVAEALRGFREDEFAANGGGHLVIAHAPIYPPGHELPYENYPAQMWADAMGNSGYCTYGHVHEYHGTWEAAGVRFCNNGALSRGALHEYNLTRQVMATLWDSQDGSFTEVPLSAKPASEVFRLRENHQVTDTTGKLEDFLTSIGAAQFDVISVEAVKRHVDALDIAQDVKDEVAELLEWSVHQA